MKRRSVLGGGLGLVGAAAGGALLWRPDDLGSPHSEYFARLNELLKRDGPGHPVMVIDIDRMNHNVDVVARSVGAKKTYRVVVKSLPSVPLLRGVMERARTDSLMVFHQPFLNEIAENFPQADVLLGKPMPISAAKSFYKKLGNTPFDPAGKIQWLIDTQQRLEQYLSLARELGVHMRINVEIDVGLHRGGLAKIESLDKLLKTIKENSDYLAFSGFMGYEPQLTGLRASLDHPAVRKVLETYRNFIDRAKSTGIDPDQLTLNGAGSHTLAIYEKDATMNDLAAGSAIVKPTDFDTFHLTDNQPALFIATPVLKAYGKFQLPGESWVAGSIRSWDPNFRHLYYIYGGYWKARFVSPAGIPESMYRSTNQQPITTSERVDLAVDDYVFLRPTQSELVMLQFGDLLVMKDGELIDTWPVFHQTG